MARPGIFFLNGSGGFIYGRGVKRFPHCRTYCAISVSLLLAVFARTQTPEGPTKQGVHAQYNQKTGKPEWVASYLTASEISRDTELIQGLQLVLFNTDGQSNLIVNTPQCLFDLRGKVVSSADRLQARSVSGEFSLEGEGFQCQLTEERLAVSNRVHAIVRKDLLTAPSPTNLSAVATAAQTNSPGPPQVLHIYSDRLRYQTNLAVFENNARAEDPQGDLAAGLLTVRFTEPERRIENIQAEQGVVINSEQIHATGQRGNYLATNDVLELFGNPTWQLGQYEGRADELTVHRRAHAFHAVRNVEMTLPEGALGTNGFFLAETASATNAAVSKTEPVKAYADDFDFRPDATDTNLNVALLDGHVRVSAEKGNLSCGRMTVRSSRLRNRTETVLIEQGVVMAQGNNRVTGERAVYTAANDSMEVSGAPAWTMDQREGTAEVLVLDLKRRAYRATRNVQMRLPPGSLGKTPWMLPKAAATNRPPAAAASGPGPDGRVAAVSPVATNWPGRPIEISADDLEFAPDPANRNLNVASFRGAVRVNDPGRMKLSCESLTGEMPAGANRMDRVVAERNVELDVREPNREGTARGDRAVYTASDGRVVLTDEESVAIAFRNAKTRGQGWGRKAVYAGEADILELQGNPHVTTQQGQVWGDTLILDHGQTTVKATGHWKLELNAAVLQKATEPATEPAAAGKSGSEAPRPSSRSR